VDASPWHADVRRAVASAAVVADEPVTAADVLRRYESAADESEAGIDVEQFVRDLMLLCASGSVFALRQATVIRQEQVMFGESTAPHRTRSVWTLFAGTLAGTALLAAGCGTQPGGSTQAPQPPPPPLHSMIRGKFVSNGEKRGLVRSPVCQDAGACVESSPADTDIEVDPTAPAPASAPGPH
jgi:hypothetical protein